MTTSYSIRPKTLDMIHKHLTPLETPGPGTYKTLELEPAHGRFHVSKFGDGKLAKINPKTPRFEEIKDSPGPLTYKEGDSLSNEAKYVLSQRRGRGTRAFEHEARFTADFWKTSKYPGPADYSKPS